MAHVIQCDACKKIGNQSDMKRTTISIGDEDTNPSWRDNSRSGDFCSFECAKAFIEKELTALWYHRY